MRNTNRRIRRVHRLASRSGRTERIDAKVLVVDVDFHFLRFGQNRNSNGRGMNSTARFRSRHSLHAMNAALELELAVGAAAFYERDNFLETANTCRIGRKNFDAPALRFGIS